MEEAEAPSVARRQCVADLKIQEGELTREVGPAPAERGGAKRPAGVETAQDLEDQVVGEGIKAVLIARPPEGEPAPAREQILSGHRSPRRRN